MVPLSLILWHLNLPNPCQRRELPPAQPPQNLRSPITEKYAFSRCARASPVARRNVLPRGGRGEAPRGRLHDHKGSQPAPEDRNRLWEPRPAANHREGSLGVDPPPLFVLPDSFPPPFCSGFLKEWFDPGSWYLHTDFRGFQVRFFAPFFLSLFSLAILTAVFLSLHKRCTTALTREKRCSWPTLGWADRLVRSWSRS
jgi:hypothetical protein